MALADNTCKKQALTLLECLAGRIGTPIARRQGTTIPQDEVDEWVDLFAACYGGATKIPEFLKKFVGGGDIQLNELYCSHVFDKDSELSKEYERVKGWKDKKVTCGFFIQWNNMYLAMLPTGRRAGYGQFDIPKGCCEEGEEHLACALRELKEETSIDLDNYQHSEIEDWGVLPYNKEKDIHLFSVTIYTNEKDLTYPTPPTIECTSTFVNEKGETVPEMSSHKWSDTMEDFFPNLVKAYDIHSKHRNHHGN